MLHVDHVSFCIPVFWCVFLPFVGDVFLWLLDNFLRIMQSGGASRKKCALFFAPLFRLPRNCPPHFYPPVFTAPYPPTEICKLLWQHLGRGFGAVKRTQPVLSHRTCPPDTTFFRKNMSGLWAGECRGKRSQHDVVTSQRDPATEHRRTCLERHNLLQPVAGKRSGYRLSLFPPSRNRLSSQPLK